MHTLHRLAGRLFGVPLVVLPEYAQVIATAFADRFGVEPMVSQETVESYKRPAFSKQIDRRSGIAVLPIVGGLVHRADSMDAASGVQSYATLQNTLDDLLADTSVRGILLDIDSPGGEVAGLQELASMLPKMSRDKPIWAVANGMTASAAYWLASSTDRLYATPGSNVGSIGVYTMHVDVSKQMEKRGVVHTFVHAGKKKVEGNPFEPLPDGAREDRQAEVDAIWETFAAHVATHRGLTTEQVKGFEAAVFSADKAEELGLVDRVATYGEVLTAFKNHLNAPMAGQLHGVNMSSDRLLYSEADRNAARAEGHAAGLKEGNTVVAAAVAEAETRVRNELVAAVEATFTGAKAETFVEALKDGASVALATKFASKIDEPKVVAEVVKSRTAADVDRIMAADSPNVQGDDGGAADPKAERLAQIAAATKSFNRGRGYARN